MKKLWRVEIRGIVTFTVDNKPATALRGLYIMEEKEDEMYELSRGGEPTFRLTLMAVAQHVEYGDLIFLDHDWPPYRENGGHLS
jgi:hypothetical protein